MRNPIGEADLQPVLKFLVIAKERGLWMVASTRVARELRVRGIWDDAICVEAKSTRKERRAVRERSDGT